MLKICEYCKQEYEGDGVKRYPKGKSLGYKTFRFCSKDCSKKNHQANLEKSNIEKYGVKNPFQLKEVKEKIKQTNLARYGSEYNMQLGFVKEKRKQTYLKNYGVEHSLQAECVKEKSRRTCLKKYGAEIITQSAVFRKKYEDTCLKKYGVENPSQSVEIQSKKYATKKKNDTFITSKFELEAFNLIKQKYPDMLTHVAKVEYNNGEIDVYIPSLDLYIELQGHQAHGKCVFDPTNPAHIQIVEKGNKKSKEINHLGKQKKMYNRMIKGGTIEDPLKRRGAKEHNLNGIEFGNISEIKKGLK